MLSRAMKEHHVQKQRIRNEQELKRKEAFDSSSVVVDKLVSTLNDGVEEVYQNQKKLEAESKQLQAHAAQFSKQTIQWLQLAEGFNRALKELGDVENWSQVIEAEMTTIAGALEYAYKVWNDGTSSIIEKLTKLQGRAARAITGESYEDRSTDILQKHHIMCLPP